MSQYKKPIWKRVWFWLIVLIILGGAGISATKDNPSTADEPKKTEAKEFYALGEEVKLKDNVLIVTGISKNSGIEWDKPKDGQEFIVVNVTLKNGGDDEISYNPYDFSIQNSQGQITNTTFTTIDKTTALHTGKLAPKGEISGTIVFQEPINDSSLILKYKASIFSDSEIKVKLN